MLTAHARSKFHYTLREAGEARAELRMPLRPALARNARFSLGANGHVEIDAAGITYRIDYETFDAPTTGARRYGFFLMRGETAVATATQEGDRPLRYDVVAGDASFALVRLQRWGGLRFAARDGDVVLGEIRETTRLLALARRFELALPSGMELPLQAFALFLAVNATYR